MVIDLCKQSRNESDMVAYSCRYYSTCEGSSKSFWRKWADARFWVSS